MPRSALALLAALGVVLTLTLVPGVFTIDEDNYLVTVTALREGGLTVPGTDGLPASPELVWFDPQSHLRKIEATPVAPTAPPLYAPLALPFALLGWRGLFALNTVAFLVAAGVVFLYARRYAAPRPEEGEAAAGEAAGWVAMGVFILGGYGIEYAQAVWPHMVTVALCAGAAYLAARVRDGEALWLAAAAGLLAGWAAGVRYQNVVFALLLGGTVFLFAPRRWRASLLYGGGAALPLLLSSAINHARLGFWNPVSKGARYFTRGSEPYPHGPVHEFATMLWARLVDYSQRPPLSGLASAYLSPHPESGVYLVGNAVKKAWLQSAPWLVLALAACLTAWLARRAPAGGGDAAPDAAAALRRELKSISLLIFPILAMFAYFGANRTDGVSFNQRYFLELVPLGAVAFAWAVPGIAKQRRSLALGSAVGLALAAATLTRPAGAPVRHLALAYLPLLLALALLTVWGWAFVRGRRQTADGGHRRPLALLAGAAVLFSLGAHLGDDLSASRQLRRGHLELAAAASPLLPDGSALFAIWGAKDPYGPLLLDRDLVIADPFADRGATAPRLVDSFLDDGRRVFVVLPFPPPLLEAMRGGRPVVRAGGRLAEIRPASPTPSPPASPPR